MTAKKENFVELPGLGGLVQMLDIGGKAIPLRFSLSGVFCWIGPVEDSHIGCCLGPISKDRMARLTYVVKRAWISTGLILHEEAGYITKCEVIITVQSDRGCLIEGHSGEHSKCQEEPTSPVSSHTSLIENTYAMDVYTNVTLHGRDWPPTRCRGAQRGNVLGPHSFHAFSVLGDRR